MRKLFVLAIALVACVSSSFAQKGEMGGGVNLSYGTEISNLGLGLKYQYGITDAIRLEGSFDYFLKKDGLKMWDINANAHYLFPIAEKLKVYPLVGLTYANCGIGGSNGGGNFAFADLNGNGKWDEGEPRDPNSGDENESGSSSSSKFGVNLGVGAQYDITDKIAISLEAKYQIISNFNQLVIGAGVAYKF